MLNKILSVTNSELDALDMSKTSDVQTWFTLKSGSEHYRLLAYISALYKDEVLLDIGSYLGDSARALNHSGNNKIVSFDVTDNHLSFTGVEFIIDNVLDFPALILLAPFILLDTYHNGDFEREFMDKLHEIGYKGLIMFDDIHLNEHMRSFWEDIKDEKYDISHIGHHSGTGLVKL